MLISVDFDGTIVEHEYPKIGKTMPGAFETMKALQAAGHKLILNTCREDYDEGRYLTDAVEFCRANGIEFRSVNCNHPEDRFVKEGCRKVYADVYIDDRNFGGFPGWDSVRLKFGLYDSYTHEWGGGLKLFGWGLAS
jgi:hypothetical protein